jgi:hypothetical protein
VLSTLSSLRQLIEASNETRPSLSLLVPTARRAIEAIGNILFPSKSPSNLPVDIQQTLCPLTCYVFSNVLSLLSTRRPNTMDGSSLVDNFLGVVGDAILVPVIRSFVPLSRSYASAIFAECQSPLASSTADVRSDFLCLLTEVTSSLDSETGSQSARYLRERLALEAIRQIEGLYPDPASVADSSSVGRRRIEKLADKDALSYLCSVLNLMFTSLSVSPQTVATTSADSSLSAGLLKDAIITSLSGLLRRIGNGKLAHRSGCGVGCSDSTRNSPKFQEGNVVDEVGHGTILATIERAWLFWLASSYASPWNTLNLPFFVIFQLLTSISEHKDHVPDFLKCWLQWSVHGTEKIFASSRTSATNCR